MSMTNETTINTSPNRWIGGLLHWTTDLPSRVAGWLGRWWRSRPRLGRWVDQLGTDSKSVADAADRIESRFLEIAGVIEGMSDHSETLVKEAEKVADVALGKGDSSALQTAGTNLITWLNSLDEARRNVHGVLSGIERHQRRLERILNQEKRLQQTIGTLQILPSLFKIESAPLTEQNRRQFLDLVKDIECVHTKVAQSLRDSFHSVKSTGTRLADGRNRVQHFVETKCRAIAERKEQLEASLKANNEQLERNRSENVSLLEVTRETNRQVGRIVIALQYQDITRQKLQHIGAMRSEVESALMAGGSNRQLVQFCSEAAELCNAHSDSVLDDLDSACSEINSGVGEIEQRLGRLDEIFNTLRQFSDLAISANGFIQTMLEATEEVKELTGDLVSGVKEMRQVIEPFRTALSGLSVAMGRVSAEIRLIALNAQVQAIQSGLGTGLEILSARTCDVADEMQSIGEEMSMTLKEITDTVEDDLNHCRSIQDLGASMLEQLETDGQNDAARLHAYRDQALELLVTVHDLSAEIGSQAREVTTASSLESLIKPVLCQTNENLAELGQAARSLSSASRHPDPRGRSVEHFRRLYSIADEHEIHDRVFGVAEEGANPPPDPAAASGGEFQPLPSLAATSSSAADSEPVLFSTTVTSNTAPPESPERESEPARANTPARPAPDLGDNIELF